MKKEQTSKRIVVLLVSLILLCTVTVGGVVAYIISRSDSIRNEFEPAQVTCKIEETFIDNIKKDVHVKNTGNVDAFIRAIVVVNWVSDGEKSKIHSSVPKEGVDYSIEWGAEGWKKAADGFWYYEAAVAPENVTKDLIESATTILDAPEGYHLQIQILTSALQTTPKTVVEQEWGIKVQEGILEIEN